jgi:hypothetical protein
VRIDATVWVFSATSNWLDLFFAPDANGPVWAPIATLQATASGQQVISTTFTLPFGPLPAIRGNWRFSSTANPCTTGSFDDRDDLIFAIQPSGEDTTPPTATITAPSAGAAVRGTITVNVTATDDVGVTQVELLVDGTVRGTDTSPPYSFALDTTLLGAGAHELLARASDAAENTGLSSTVSIVVDNVAPSVSITAPPANASVTGNVTVSANAADTPSGVALVEFFADGAPIGSDSTAPYSVVWNTATVIPGAHTLSARASDLAGNQTLSANVPVTVVVNQAPVVSAGPDRTVTLPAAATLSGTASDDGLPAPPALTVAWSRTSGPGTVTFANPATASTTATFSAAGVYVLRLTASDGALTAFDEMQVTVSGGTATPCQGLCTNPTIFTINGSFQSGNLTTSARCFQTTSVIHGGNCGNFVSPRTLSVNGQQRPCNYQNWSSVPAPRNGGYCIQVTSGNHPWAYLTAW